MLGGIISNSGDLTINGEILNTKINVYNCSFENPWTSGNDVQLLLIWKIILFLIF